MTAAEEGEDEEAVPQAGVLGNLPRTRPSVRSPRREEQPAPPKREARAKSEDPQPRPAAGERPGQPPPADPVGADAGAGPGSDLEALARGGIAIAGEAASLGLRIAGRAAAAIRDSVERR